MAFLQPQAFGKSANDSGDSADSRHPDYIAMIPRYKLINALKGGSEAMRFYPEYLPKFPKEDDTIYSRRLAKAFLDPSFAVAIESHTGKPFSHEIVVEGFSEDPRLAPLIDNTDGEGNDITEFTKRVFEDADSYGKSHILVDYSASDAVSRKDEMDSETRATLVHIKCLDLFFWDTDGDGMTEIRYHREATEAYGSFGRRQVKEIVRWTRDRWEVYRKTSVATEAQNEQQANQEKLDTSSSEWALFNSGRNSLGVVPLVNIYFKRTGAMRADPPNYELAELNLLHYQDNSDQRRLEEIARVGILFAKGFDADELKDFSINSNYLAKSGNEEAELSVVEHTGAAVGIGKESIKAIEEKMRELSLKPEINRSSGDVTASEVISNSFNSCSDLLNWTIATEKGLLKAMDLAYKYIGAKKSEEFKLSVYKDFVIVGNVSDLPVLIDAKREGILPASTVRYEMKRRGSIDIQHDLKKMEAEVAKEQKEAAEFNLKNEAATAKITQESTDEDTSDTNPTDNE